MSLSLEDRLNIHEFLARAAYAYDVRDVVLLESGFAPDCSLSMRIAQATLSVPLSVDELRELIHKSQEMYPKAYPGAKWMEKKSQWTFPSGARIWMTYLEQDKDVLRYQGQAFTYIGIDELTQYSTPYAWDYLRSRLRTADPSLPVFMRATTNPGGPGHAWVKKMFIDPSPHNTSFWATDITTGETLVYPERHSKAGTPLFKRRFIPAKLLDNPYLYEQGDYEAMLLSLLVVAPSGEKGHQ